MCFAETLPRTVCYLYAAALCGAVLAGACARDAPRPAEGTTARPAERQGGDAEPAAASGGAWAVDPDASWVVAVTDKSGALGFLGHRHAVLVTDWRAEIDWRPQAPGESRARVTASTAGLRIDTEQGLRLAGLEKGPDADTVKKLQAKMLDAEHLAAESHPEIVFEVTGARVSGEEGLVVAGRLALRGKTRELEFPVQVSRLEGGAVRFTGEFTVAHTDFGIRPESVAGVVNVADPVAIRFQITARPR